MLYGAFDGAGIAPMATSLIICKATLHQPRWDDLRFIPVIPFHWAYALPFHWAYALQFHWVYTQRYVESRPERFEL